MPAFENIRKALLEDRARQAERERNRIPQPRERNDFDPFKIDWSKAIVVAGSDPGYLPSTPMRRGAVGFHIACKACGGQFESKGWAYCPTCMELPAEERRAMRPVAKGRLCQAPRCENFVPKDARADVIYCSKACRDRAYRMRRETDNHAPPPDMPSPENETDNGKKDQ